MTSMDRLRAIYADLNALGAASSLLNWDRAVLMPTGGVAARTAHLRSLTNMAHAIRTGDAIRHALEDAAKEVEPGSDDAAYVSRLSLEVEQAAKLPSELVDRRARVTADAYGVWRTARENDDFTSYALYLREIVALTQEVSQALNPTAAHVYDPLIDLYEEGATIGDAQTMFDAIRPPIVELVKAIQERGLENDDQEFRSQWDRPKLREFMERTTSQIGFSFEAGRLDITPNAFCMNLSNRDVRMTTRASDHLKGILSSSLHEMGHGLYEQNSPDKWDLTPLAGGASLAVHESQSRMWENIIGRSLAFWQHFLPDLQATFPELSALTPEQFYRKINRVEPTFIRVGSDELTYNLHILIRFELEVALLTGALEVRDLPGAWNEKYTNYLGITPPRDGLGVLQDVHWSHASFGYFPTYAMGNLIGAQMWETMLEEIPHPEEQFTKGDFAGVLGWFRENVYQHANRFSPKELVVKVTGKPTSPDAWLRYATKKFEGIYGL